MKLRNGQIIAAILILAGCTVPTPEVRNPSNKGVNVPEAVAALAAPDQDLTSAQLLPEDGCYWYEHSGPVETTLVPLRAVGGSPICTAHQS